MKPALVLFLMLAGVLFTCYLAAPAGWWGWSFSSHSWREQ